MKTQLQPQSFLQTISILSILVLAFLVRMIGVNFGLPDVFHADEPIIVNHALAFGAGDLNPHFFKIPPLVSYVLFFVYGIYFLIGSLVGYFKSVDDFLNLFLRDSTSFYLLGRIIFGIMLGTGTVYVLYRLVRTFFSTAHGLLSAFFLAVSFLHVRDSHYIYADIPLLFLLVFSFFPIFKVLEHGERKDYLWFGVLFGAAVATKYNAVFLSFPFLLAHSIRKRSIKLIFTSIELYLALVLSVCIFFMLNPFSLIDLRFFISELLAQSQSEGFLGFFHHFKYSLSGGMGISLFYLSLAGILWSVFLRDSKRLVMLSFVVVYSVVLAVWSQPYDRYALPLLPFLCLFASDALIKMSEKIKILQKWPFVFAVAFAIPSMAKIAVSDCLFLQKDVRTEAREWIEQHIPSNSKVALDIPFYVPKLKPSLNQLIERKNEIMSTAHDKAQQIRFNLLISEAEKNSKARYKLFFLNQEGSQNNFIFSKPSIPYNLQSLKEAGIEYVVISQVNRNLNSQFNSNLKTEGTLLKKFSPYKDEKIEWSLDDLPLTGGPFLWKDLINRRAGGQIIKIYKLKNV